MASRDVPHSFQKLRIATSAPKPVSSPFTSLRADGSGLGEVDASQERAQTRQHGHLQSKPNGYGHSYGHAQQVGVADFANASAPCRTSTEGVSSRRSSLESPDADEVSPSAASETSSPDASLRSSRRSRGMSVTFDPQKTLDSGAKLELEQPLPRSERTPRSRGRSLMQALHDSSASPPRAHSESEKSMFNPFTGEPIGRDGKEKIIFRPGESRHPLLQSTVDDLAKDAALVGRDRVASLTSATTASPTVDEIRTPQEPVEGSLLSPLPVTSPVEISPRDVSADWSHIVPRPRSMRSKSYRTENSSNVSLRKASRRSTAFSATPSVSPAGAFLSKWGRDEAAAMIEPDDEGQEIGDHSEYIIGRQIGFGGFSVVKEVFTIENGEKVRRAVKIVRKQVSGKSDQENETLQNAFEHEVSIWRFLRHRYVLPLIAVYDSPFATFCITQLNTGGTLFDLVRSTRKTGSVSGSDGVRWRSVEPRLARKYSYQLASAIRYLHEDVRVVHRDIKLENCLLDMSGPDAATEGGNVLLCDFGMADYITSENRASPEISATDDDQPLYMASSIRAAHQNGNDVPDCGSSPPDYQNGHSRYIAIPHQHTDENGANFARRSIGPSELSTSVVGSLHYAAPETIDAPRPLYSTALDIWSYGVVVYALLVGDLPFQHAFEPKLVLLVLRGEWDPSVLRRIVEERSAESDDLVLAEQLVHGCMRREIDKRWSIADVLATDWFDGCMELYGDFDDDGGAAWV